MLVKTFSASVQGLQATGITVEVNATRGVRFALVGLPDSAVKESYERITAAIENSGYEFPTRQTSGKKVRASICLWPLAFWQRAVM